MSESIEPAVPTGYGEPATARQRGALVAEFVRLGYPRTRSWRARRLADSAILLGIDKLSSSTELTKGEAGRLLHMLRDCRTMDDLRALAGMPPFDPETGPVSAQTPDNDRADQPDRDHADRLDTDAPASSTAITVTSSTPTTLTGELGNLAEVSPYRPTILRDLLFNGLFPVVSRL